MRHLAFPLLFLAGCTRTADEPIDYDSLRAEACTSACAVIDTCDPDRFAGMDPEDCFERCSTLLPRLQEENQCGSREIIHLECLGKLTCDEFEQNEIGSDLSEPSSLDFDAPCVTELHWAVECDHKEPFNLDEPAPTAP
ncbi:hypothetical protein G6O69_11060 [Pseudenhygromyxa sp. WMMC2535]|uniref:hypothetical protein n=1 Tax=Pseudenhygromyxa sp. WMMC2535 TaxID=2712867 RepID=UPI001556DF70|nr:hypothetical protein [Pseudenhygromyxa sp. WMMC2535]NVB38370.1 hypothetical protein [Pseudenhygromyxa sp. WMMC2535]